ncbi:MAG: long-chain fatty acid--CoA ligase [Patescibacteria group bacterium]|jgi:long-chain acyl-CoA synthetase
MTIAKRYKSIAEKFGANIALAYLVDGQYKTISYNDLDIYRERLADIWHKLGFKKGETLAIMLPNAPEWIISDLAAATLGLIVVPLHTTYNGEYLKKMIKHSGSKYLVIHQEFLEKHKAVIDSLNLDKIFIVNGQKDFVEKNISLWPDLDEARSLSPIDTIVSSDDIHTIIYTSGTTGDPKGVMLTHKNFIVDVESAKRSVAIYASDRFFSFLPLSHIFERTAGYYTPLFTGASVYFAQSSKTIIDDIKKAQPTILNSVPRIFEKVHDKVFDKIQNGGHLKRKLFFEAVQMSVDKRKGNLNFFRHIIWKILDLLVLKKVRGVLGGKLRLAISGGASLDLKIIKFFDNLGIKIIEGYGMTETSPIIALNKVENSRPGTVGQAIDCNEVMIGDNKEILLRGANVMAGYYQAEDLTSEIIDKDGWLHTGDLGFIDKDGFISIIGRSKDVIVLSTGKNIFPESIENVLNESRYIIQSMIYGDKQKHISAFIVPDFEQLKQWCVEQGIKFDLKDEKIIKFYEEKINERLKESAKIEQINYFKLIPEEFTQENGLLTPTLKLRRYKILEKYVNYI